MEAGTPRVGIIMLSLVDYAFSTWIQYDGFGLMRPAQQYGTKYCHIPFVTNGL